MSDLKSIAQELILGDFNDGESSKAGIAGNIIIGFIPFVGQAADLRDTIAAIKEVGSNHQDLAAWAGLGIAVICWIPGLDALKTLKILKKSKSVRKVKKVSEKIGKTTVRASGLEDRKTFKASEDFFRRYKWLFGENHNWSLEHLIIKQRYYRSRSKNFENHHLLLKLFPKGSKMNRVLQIFGDGGINLVPVPKKFNQWLYHHSFASTIFTISCYTFATSFVYGSIQIASNIEEKIDELLFGEEIAETEGLQYSKKIIID